MKPFLAFTAVFFFIDLSAFPQTTSPGVNVDPISISTISVPGGFVTTDPAANFYRPDQNQAEKSSTAAVKTVVAGTNATGYAYGPSATEQFSAPSDFTIDIPGNKFVAAGTVSAGAANAIKRVANGTQLQPYPPSSNSVNSAEMDAFRSFIKANGSLVPGIAAASPVITLESSSPTLAGATISRNDSRIRYIGGYTVENFDNIQPGNYPKDRFTTAKNVSFSSTERSAIGAIVEFDITCPKFEIFEYETGGGVRVLVDNQIAGGYAQLASGDLSYYLFDFTAINANPVQRHIRLEYSSKAAVGGLKLGSSGALLPLQDVVDYRICWLGDSFTEGTGVASNQTLHAGLAAYASKILGFRDYRMSGFGGTGYNVALDPVSTPVRPSLADRIIYDGVDADVFVIAMGINDRESDPALAGKIISTLDILRAKNPTSLIVVLGPYGDGSGHNIKPNVENKIISAAANRRNVKFISIYDIAFTKSDATHPDAGGHITLGIAIASRIKVWVGAVDTFIGNGTGLKGLYLYYDPNQGTLPDSAHLNIFLERIDSAIDFEFTYSNLPLVKYPVPGTMQNRGYGMRWTGKIQAQYSELYTFYTLADDGTRLWINDVLLIDNWKGQAVTEKAKTIPLIAGLQYDIKIEHYQHAGDGVAKLYWSSASTPKLIVPKSQLYASLQGASFPNTSAFAPATASLNPNPVKRGRAGRLQINSNRTGEAIVSVVSSNGSGISNQRIKLVKGINITSVSTAALAQGLYLINITNGDKPITVKMIVD